MGSPKLENTVFVLKQDLRPTQEFMGSGMVNTMAVDNLVIQETRGFSSHGIELVLL